MLLATAVINKKGKSMYPKSGVVVPTGSCLVLVETQPDALPQENTIECPENWINKEQVPLACSVAKQETIPGLSEALVSVRTSGKDLQLVLMHDKLTQNRLETWK